MQLRECSVFDDRYRLTKLLGRGLFSEVWLVEDTKAGDMKKALKVYAPETGLGDDDVKLFIGEFERLVALNHRNILRPTYFDVCDCSPYLVLPYCEKGSTAKLVGNMSEDDAWRFLRDAAAALAYLHGRENPVVHRGIKPENILIDDEGNYLAADSGISARARSALLKRIGNVKSGNTIARYMPPECFEDENTLSSACDVWSLGATLFELLDGIAPFPNFSNGHAQLNGAQIPETTGNWSPELTKIITLCLQKEAGGRPTAEQLVEWTAAHFSGEKIPFDNEKKKNKANLREAAPDIDSNIAGEDNNPQDAPASPQLNTGARKHILAFAILAVSAVVLGLLVFYFTMKHEVPTTKAPTKAPRAAAGKVQEAHHDIAMAYVRGGTFTMGCTPEQGDDCYGDENPVRRVTLSDFYMGKYEVTQAQWKSVMGEDNNPSNFKGDNLPVDSVSWDEALEFIEKLNEMTGGNYRLPTEAEHEYAARGGSSSRGYKYSGSNNINEVAWHDGNSGKSTHPVGTKKANELGIYDMSGNVFEWTSDLYGAYDGNPQTNPQGADSGSIRVFRGGSWYNNARFVRVTYRNYTGPDNSADNLGLRLAANIK